MGELIYFQQYKNKKQRLALLEEMNIAANALIFNTDPSRNAYLLLKFKDALEAVKRGPPPQA